MPGVWLGGGVVAGVSTTACCSALSTGRKYSFAVCPTCAAASFSPFPLGMLMTMWSLPWVCTSASDTPNALTRSRMIDTAVFMLSGLTAFLPAPWSGLAFSVTLVPPARSMPSRGVVSPVANMIP